MWIQRLRMAFRDFDSASANAYLRFQICACEWIWGLANHRSRKVLFTQEAIRKDLNYLENQGNTLQNQTKYISPPARGGVGGWGDSYFVWFCIACLWFSKYFRPFKVIWVEQRRERSLPWVARREPAPQPALLVYRNQQSAQLIKSLSIRGHT